MWLNIWLWRWISCSSFNIQCCNIIIVILIIQYNQCQIPDSQIDGCSYVHKVVRINSSTWHQKYTLFFIRTLYKILYSNLSLKSLQNNMSCDAQVDIKIPARWCKKIVTTKIERGTKYGTLFFIRILQNNMFICMLPYIHGGLCKQLLCNQT